MRATPLAGGCATVAIALGVIGLYLDSLAAMAGAMGLTGLLCGQGVLFLYRTARVADDLRVERRIESRHIYLGASAEVVVQATTTATPGLQVRLTDLPPQSAVYDPGEALLRNGEGRYQVRLMTPGVVSFRGLLVETANGFFTTTILHRDSRDAGGKFVVSPIGNGTVNHTRGNSDGAKEQARAGWPQGEGIRGFRPFHQGDDPARMDWKLTAKHGRPFVRELTAEAGSASLVIVDLPAPEAPGAVAVLSAASVEIRREVREHGQCTLLLITGGEVIAYHQQERDLLTLLRHLNLRPPGLIRPMYRVKDPLVLMERLRSAERELCIPSQRFATALRTALGTEARSAFEWEIDSVLAAAEHQRVIVFTASSADVSHLNLIAASARRRKRRLVIRLPRSQKISMPWLSRYPRVEAI